jgi:hypothetical protein
MSTTDLSAELKTFLDYVQELNKDNDQVGFEFEFGSKYIRIVCISYGSRSAYGFINKTNGDFLKSASWNAPAKHPRGNLFNKETWTNAGPYSFSYLR